MLAVVFLLSGYAIAAAQAAPLSNAGPVLAGLAAQAQDRKLDEAERIHSIEALGAWATVEVRPPLVALLKDPSVKIRGAAAKSLGWPGNTAAIDPLKERVTDKKEQDTVRSAAVGSLVKIGDPSARSILLAASQDSDPVIREEAFRGLIGGPLESKSDLASLAARAAQDTGLGRPFRADAIRALARTKDPTAVPVLIKLLETGPRLKIQSPPPGATEQQVLAVRYLQIGDVRAWAAKELGDLGARSALPALVKASEDPDDFFLRYVVAGTLMGWKAPEGLPTLLRLMDDPTFEVREVAVKGVGIVGSQADVDAVAARLTDEVPSVRARAVEALATIGGNGARQHLQVAMANEKHPQVRQAMEAALAHLKN